MRPKVVPLINAVIAVIAPPKYYATDMSWKSDD